jgi:cell wall-associated NlpC family hydrolase
MDVNQLVTIKLLNAMSQYNTNNRANSNNNSDIFDLMLEDILGGEMSTNQTCTCSCHSSQSGLGTLDTLLSFMNSNKIQIAKPSIETNNNKTKILNTSVEANKVQNTNPSTEAITNKTPITNKNIEPTVNNIQNSSSKMDNAISLLKSQVGKSYVWGANGPNSFDCSGLVKYIYKNALEKNIPRTSYEQSKFGQAVDRKDLQVGDLVFFDTMGKGRVSHVGMYIGNNEFIHAANEKDGVKQSKLTGYYERHYIGARRP